MLLSLTNVGDNVFGTSASIARNVGAFVRYCVGRFVGLRVVLGFCVGTRCLLFEVSVASGPRVSDAVGTAAVSDL